MFRNEVLLPDSLLKYYYLTAFWVKLISLMLAIAFTFSVRRRVVMANERKLSVFRSKLVALVSISLWTSVALAGRLIGFP